MIFESSIPDIIDLMFCFLNFIVQQVNLIIFLLSLHNHIRCIILDKDKMDLLHLFLLRKQ